MEISHLLERPLPPLYVLKELDKIASQQWLNGMQSIKDPRYNHGTEYFPLCALTFWLGSPTKREVSHGSCTHTLTQAEEEPGPVRRRRGGRGLKLSKPFYTRLCSLLGSIVVLF